MVETVKISKLFRRIQINVINAVSSEKEFFHWNQLQASENEVRLNEKILFSELENKDFTFFPTSSRNQTHPSM